MANEHATPQSEELKKQGDELEGALGNASVGKEKTGTHNEAIPAPENGGHARSAAAHLKDHSHIHDNKNAVQHHVPSNALREPPQEVSRVGKGHRGE